MSLVADLEVASLAESLAQVVADEVWMIEVCRNCLKNKQKQCLSLCIPSDEALGGYAEAPTTGKTAQELDPEGKAADELRRLYMFTSELLNMLNGKLHEHKQNGRVAKRA